MEFVESLWNTTAMLAPFLLLGLAMAGILHVVVPAGLVRRQLSGRGLGPVVRAVLVGVPLPLCSCGVVPVAQHLRKDGAGKGAVAGFLASTPSTGADSISATWGMLGPGFALVRVSFAVVSGLVAGWVVEFLGGRGPEAGRDVDSCPTAPAPARRRGAVGLLRDAWEHGFGEVLFPLRKWLVVGIVAGALLAWLLPRGVFEGALGSPVLAYLAMIAASGPLYVCATGSIPIAASLVAKGMSPGAALVFLTVGPATNTAMLGFLGSSLGRRALFAYVGAVVVLAVAAGALLDLAGTEHWIPALVPPCHTSIAWWEHASAGLLLVLMFRDLRLPRFRKTRTQETNMQISIPSISCGNCARHVTRALEPVPGVREVAVDVAGKSATVAGTADPKALLAALEAAGYPGILRD